VKKAVAPHVSAVKTAKPKPADALANPEDSLVSEGEKYLYGNGVPQNCERAQKDILTAARQQNSRAYTLLGAMYATGHCVSRDLPTAYRWFARALHQDPGNTRLQQNLEVIWRQMTPEERQVATHG
jgi:TPR repeat protein